MMRNILPHAGSSTGCRKKSKDVIKALRVVEPNMWKIDETTFVKANVCLGIELIRALLMPFSDFAVPESMLKLV